MLAFHADQAQKSEDQIFEESRALHKQGRIDDALAALRDGLSRNWLSAQGVEKAGKRIGKLLDQKEDKRINVLILAQCTSTWLTSCLTAAGWARGAALNVRDGQYDNVLQELLAAKSSGDKIDVVVLLPWNQQLLSDEGGTPEQRIEDTVGFWKQAWGIVAELGARLVQVGFDSPSPGPLGTHLSVKENGPLQILASANSALRQNLPSNAFFVDLGAVAGNFGRERFYDPRRYYWTKQPFGEEGTVRLTQSIFAGIRALTTGPKKVLVLDLDNTLWGGVVGETGPMGIEIGDTPAGEAFRAFQKYVKGLARRGVVLAVSSKNNYEDAREPFRQNPDMQFKLEDFGAFEACWDPKAVAIERMALTLALGIDSFVFFDDNPAEREQVRQALPDVEVVEVPEDPAEFIRALEAGQWFESVALTAEDRVRSHSYRAEAERREVKASFGSIDEYLTSLNMLGDVRAVDDDDFTRVVQLIGKTNQFNLTTRRHTPEILKSMLAASGSTGITVRIADRFGDYGLVAVLLGVDEPAASATNGHAPHNGHASNSSNGHVKTLRIDTWLMSCRVIGRTAEEFCLNALIIRARELGYHRLLGHYIPTKKNALVKDLFRKLGFTQLQSDEAGAVSYELDLAQCASARSFITAGRHGV